MTCMMRVKGFRANCTLRIVLLAITAVVGAGMLAMGRYATLAIVAALLVYQASDQETTGWYNPTTRQYEELPDRYRPEVKKGLAIARNEKAPNLVVLPVPGPEGAQ